MVGTVAARLEKVQGQTIAHFETLDELGSGAMGVVYRARDTLLRREVALKLIRPELTADRHTRKRFLRECQVAASISHPGIATIYEAGQTEDGRLFFASELIQGESLRDRIARGPLPPEDVIDIGIQLGEALSAAHERGIVHRDIKPANLMIQRDGRVKVLDFGLARLLAGAEDDRDSDSLQTVTQTRFGVVVGTPAYMSPEQASGGNVDSRTDIFACGSVLYAAASGKEAFLTGSVPETLRRILAEDPAALETIDPTIPAGLRSVIRKALAKDPDQRYATGTELAEALRSSRIEAAPTAWLERPAAPRRRRRTRVGIGLAAAVAVLIGAVALTAWLASRPTLAFGTRDKLLIASVDNQTRDSAFDLALRTALEADLQQSRYVTVYDQSQVAETLKLMRRREDTPIDEELGRDICRFAGIRALLLPRILSVGEAYELQAILIDPASGRRVDRVRVTARGREEVLLQAIDKLARSVRRRLGESIEAIDRADEPVAQVTTSSWEALHYLTLGNRKWHEEKYRDAATMFELALDKDPEFVSAQATLGLLLVQHLNEPERGRELLAQALAEARDLPEREYLMIRAVNRNFVDGDPEAALEEYALISELYPEMMQPYNNRGQILRRLGRYDESAQMLDRAAELDPSSSVPLTNLYWLHLYSRGRPAAAEAAARRLVELSPSNSDFRHLLAWSLVVQTRFEEALVELRRVLADEPRHPLALPNTAHVLCVTDASAEAIPLYRQVLQLVSEGKLEGMQYSATRDLALALADVGERQQAEQLVDEQLALLREENPPSAWRSLATAHLAASQGRTEQARSQIADALQRGIEDAEARMLLAGAYAMIDENDQALAELERAFDTGFWDRYFPLIMPPFRGLRDDARFYRLIGVSRD